MALVNFLSNFTNGLFRHFVCFEKFHSPVSELIHLARCVKFNPYYIPGIAIIVFCGTQSNRRTNFIPRLAGFNPRLALIVFSGTGARTVTFEQYCVKVRKIKVCLLANTDMSKLHCRVPLCCTNDSRYNNALSFHRFPSSLEL